MELLSENFAAPNKRRLNTVNLPPFFITTVFTMDKKQTSPELSQAELPPNCEEQIPAPTPTRNRQIDHDNSNDEPRRKRVRLTRKNLAEFNKMTKKKTTDPSDGSSTNTKTTLTTVSSFVVKTRDNGILPLLSSKLPTNLEDIRRRHAKSRATASPPESEYERYTNKVKKAGNEATVVVEVSARLLKEYDDGYNRAYSRPFTGLPKNNGFNDGLSTPQPDFVEGLEIEQYRPFPVNKHLPGAALYQDDPYSLALPHVAGEWKGPNGSMREAELQSAYDGAALVYARNQALAHMGKSDPLGHAEVTTFTTDGTNLNMYAHYAIPSAEDEGTLEYHQYRYASANVKDSYQGYKDGRKGLRNTQDYAKAQSEHLRDQLKQHWKQNHKKL